MREILTRNEFKHDLFHNDLERIIEKIEHQYTEIRRTYESTLTLLGVGYLGAGLFGQGGVWVAAETLAIVTLVPARFG